MTIEVPFHAEKSLVTRLEVYLKEKNFTFKKKGRIQEPTFLITVETAQDAYWLGMNVCALMNKLFDGPLTKTL